jgi:hypothetical protein
MPQILGMSLGTFILRILGAAISGAVSIFIFLYIPQFVSQSLPQGILGFGESQIILYGTLIAVLAGLQMIFRDRWLGDACAIGNGVLQIYYLYAITNGGVMSFALNGTNIAINFSTLLYLLMLPSALSIVSGLFRVLTRGSLQKFQDAEEIILR